MPGMHFATPFLEPGEEPQGSKRAKRRAKGSNTICILQPHFWSREKSRKDRIEPRGEPKGSNTMHARYALCNPISGAKRRAKRIEKSQECTPAIALCNPISGAGRRAERIEETQEKSRKLQLKL